MAIEDQQCNDCGASDWTFSFDLGYPESRRERDQTIKSVYVCQSCGSEGKHFEHQDKGTEVFSGAFR